MLWKIWNTRPIRYAFLVCVFLVLGYFSNTVTASNCERHASAWVEENVSQSDWPNHRGHHQPAHFTYPWIVTVDYSWTIGNVGGAKGTRYYLSFFGVPISVGEQVHVVS